MKVAVISCSLGMGSKKHEHCKQTSEHQIDFFFLDEGNFTIRKNAMHPRLQAKIPKMLGWQLYKGYDYYIWIDANITLSNEKSVDWLIEQCKSSIAFFTHFERNTIKEEVNFILDRMSKGDQYLIKKCEFELMGEQVEFYYEHEGFEDSFLFACGVFIYKKELVASEFNLMEQWFYHCARWSVRDQLSIPFLLWLNKIKFDVIKDHMLKSEFVQYHW